MFRRRGAGLSGRGWARGHGGPRPAAEEEEGSEAGAGADGFASDFVRLDGELKMPVVSDWREMRARLAAGSEDAWRAQLRRNKNGALAGEEAWAHDLATVELGMVLLAGRDQFLTSQAYFHQTAILIVSHDDKEGTFGVILNRPTPHNLGAGSDAAGELEKAPLYWGGDAGDFITMLHGYPEIPNAIEVFSGVFCGGDFKAAGELVRTGEADPWAFRFFLRGCGWSPGQLQAELDSGVWYACAASDNVVMKHCIQLPRPLWAELLDLMGGQYADIARDEYGSP